MTEAERQIWRMRFAAACANKSVPWAAAVAATSAVLFYRIAQREVGASIEAGKFRDNPEGQAILMAALGLGEIDDGDKTMH